MEPVFEREMSFTVSSRGYGGGSGYRLIPKNKATTLTYRGYLDHANAVGTLTVRLFKA